MGMGTNKKHSGGGRKSTSGNRHDGNRHDGITFCIGLAIRITSIITVIFGICVFIFSWKYYKEFSKLQKEHVDKYGATLLQKWQSPNKYAFFGCWRNVNSPPTNPKQRARPAHSHCKTAYRASIFGMILGLVEFLTAIPFIFLPTRISLIFFGFFHCVYICGKIYTLFTILTACTHRIFFYCYNHESYHEVWDTEPEKHFMKIGKTFIWVLILNILFLLIVVAANFLLCLLLFPFLQRRKSGVPPKEPQVEVRKSFNKEVEFKTTVEVEKIPPPAKKEDPDKARLKQKQRRRKKIRIK